MKRGQFIGIQIADWFAMVVLAIILLVAFLLVKPKGGGQLASQVIREVNTPRPALFSLLDNSFSSLRFSQLLDADVTVENVNHYEFLQLYIPDNARSAYSISELSHNVVKDFLPATLSVRNEIVGDAEGSGNIKVTTHKNSQLTWWGKVNKPRCILVKNDEFNTRTSSECSDYEPRCTQRSGQKLQPKCEQNLDELGVFTYIVEDTFQPIGVIQT